MAVQREERRERVSEWWREWRVSANRVGERAADAAAGLETNDPPGGTKGSAAQWPRRRRPGTVVESGWAEEGQVTSRVQFNPSVADERVTMGVPLGWPTVARRRRVATGRVGRKKGRDGRPISARDEENGEQH